MEKHHKTFTYYFLILFAALYIGLAMGLPPKPTTLQQYHLTPTSYRMIELSVVIPLVLIWYAAFFGYTHLKRYSTPIKKNKDGKQVAKLTTGLGWLAFSLPVSSLVSTLLNYAARLHPDLLPSATIIEDYVSLLLPLVGLLYISHGARGLTELIKQRPSQRSIYLFAIILITIGASYCHAIFSNTWILATTGHKTPIYYLPNWLLFITIVVPYIFMWFIGLLAAYELHLYNKSVPGILYRKGLHLVSLGLGYIIMLSVVFQFITTLTGHINHLKINNVLLLVYGLLILISIGYILVAIGAKRLQKIEEA